ncbi:hypothetical protein ScPMuIL_003160 [Solemya velum]
MCGKVSAPNSPDRSGAASSKVVTGLKLTRTFSMADVYVSDVSAKQDLREIISLTEMCRRLTYDTNTPATENDAMPTPSALASGVNRSSESNCNFVIRK